MFEVSRRADYAVRCMLALGELKDGKRKKVGEICKEMGVPQAFLYQISQDLIRAELVSTKAGPDGGLELARDTDEISLLEIIEAVEGPICVNICLERPGECPQGQDMPCSSFLGGFSAKNAQ